MGESGPFAPDPEPRREVAGEVSASLDDPTAEARWRSVGRLLPGLAHEFKNPLAVVQGYGQLLLERAPAGSEERADVECLLAEVTRVVALVDDLHAYARQDADLPAPFDVPAGLESALGLARPLLREARVQVDVRLPTTPLVVRAPAAASLHTLVTLLCVAADELAAAPVAARGVRVERCEELAGAGLDVCWIASRERLAPTGLGELQACAEALGRHGARLVLPAFAVEPGRVRGARVLWPPPSAAREDDIIG